MLNFSEEGQWEVFLDDDVVEWLKNLERTDFESAVHVVAAVDLLARLGPSLGRPLVDRVKGSRIHNLKELRPASSGRSEIRILFAFDPDRKAVLLVAGDKRGRWRSWYISAIGEAEARYDKYLQSRKKG